MTYFDDLREEAEHIKKLRKICRAMTDRHNEDLWKALKDKRLQELYKDVPNKVMEIYRILGG